MVVSECYSWYDDDGHSARPIVTQLAGEANCVDRLEDQALALACGQIDRRGAASGGQQRRAHRRSLADAAVALAAQAHQEGIAFRPGVVVAKPPPPCSRRHRVGLQPCGHLL